ncbi:MAG: hypothetical protein O2800_04940 [Planctomycetota bacterium]|nr:hypothetical protein [Planctomycetota bacterium]
MPRFRGLSTLFAILLSFRCFAEPPHPNSVAVLWTQSRVFLDSGVIPAAEESAELPSLKAVGAVRVTLRWQGRIVGATTVDSVSPLMAIDATRTALARAEDDPAFAAVIQTNATLGGPQCTLELEVAGSPEPIVIAKMDEMRDQYAPGLDAIRLSTDTKSKWTFPSQMLAGDASNPLPTMLSLTAALHLPATDLPDLRANGSISIASAEVVRLFQLTPEGVPNAVLRWGGEPKVATRSMHADAIGRILVFLERQFPPSHLATEPAIRSDLEAQGLPDEYVLPRDRVETPVASSSAQSLIAWALLDGSGQMEEPLRAQSRRIALRVLSSLRQRAPLEPDPMSDRFSVALIAASSALLLPSETDTDIKLVQWLADVRASLLLSAEQVLPPTDPVRPVEVYAFAMIASSKNASITRDAARALIARTWDEMPEERIAAAMPWLLAAERALSLDRPLRPELAAKAIGVIVSTMCTDPGVGSRQIDVLGGLCLRGAPSTDRQSPAVGVDSALPAWGVAIQLNDSHQAGSSPILIATSRAMATFLEGLVTDDIGAALSANARRALGAVRTTPWSARTSLGATALVLRALAEQAQLLPTSSPRTDETP